ncbi:MAG: hypothetical protein QOG83_3666 [Alphaproteobacteria bacterium]|nr:hypothetical protein [Alphaproteobacteria bacterium]
MMVVPHCHRAVAADVFGFSAEQIGKPGFDPPWHGKSEYWFISPDGDPKKSINVEAVDLDGHEPNCPAVLLKGDTSNGVIGVGTDCLPDARAWLNEGYEIAPGQPAVSLEITLKGIDRGRDALWEVMGVDARGAVVWFQGNFHGGDADETVSQSRVIDQAALASAPVPPQGGFAGPVAIHVVFLKSLWAGATLPAFGATRFDAAIYLVAVKATGL